MVLNWPAVAAALGPLLMGGLATVLLLRAPGDRAARIFAYLLVVLAVLAVPNPWTADALGITAAAVRNGLPPGQFAVPVLVLYFAALFPSPRTWWGRDPRAPWLVAAGVLALEALFFLAPDLYLTSHPAPGGTYIREGPLHLLAEADELAMAVVALRFGLDWARAAPGPGRPSLLLVAVGFALLPLYQGTRVLLYEAAGLEPFSALHVTTDVLYLTFRQTYLVWALALLPAGALMGLLAREARHARGAGARAAARNATLALCAGPLAALAITLAVTSTPGVFADITGFFPRAFGLALPVLATYALLRYRMFDVELKLKVGIRQGTLVTVFLGAALVTGQLAQYLLPGESLPGIELVAAALVVLALARIHRMADVVADKALPGVRGDPAYLSERKLEVYRSALERAHAGGAEPTPREAEMLASLRAELGVSERDHLVLEYAFRSRGAPAALNGHALEPGGVVLGKYRVQRFLGAGANGATYLAEDIVLRRAVVVKALRPERASDPDVLREARAMSAIRHPNVVTVFDVDRVGDQAYIVMEHLEGGSLAERLERGPLAPQEFRVVARGVLDALAAVHEAGAVHRDVKPSNVLLTRDGEAKLADFGVAHLPGLETTAGGLHDGSSAVGTIRFMSPEQARGRRVTKRSDLFGAAATLYEAWTGEPYLKPLPGESAVELQMRAARAEPFQKRSVTPAALKAWFAKGLHPEPERRFASAKAMREALERALAP